MRDMKNIILLSLVFLGVTGCSFAGEVSDNPSSATVKCDTMYFHGGEVTFLASKEYTQGEDLSKVEVEGEQGSYLNLGIPSYPNTHTLSPIIHGTQVYVECGIGGEKDYTGFTSAVFTLVQ